MPFPIQVSVQVLVILGGDDWLFDQREPNILPKHTSAKLNDEGFGFFKLSSNFFFIRQQVTNNTMCAINGDWKLQGN